MGLTKTKPRPERTKLSTKGQIVLPKSIRSAHDWRPGTELEVEDRGDAVVLRAVKRRGVTRLEDLLGSAHYKGPSKTIKEMDAAIDAEARHWR